MTKRSVIIKETFPIKEKTAIEGDLKSEHTSKLIGEVVGGVLSCSAAIISWVVVYGSAAAIPVSGGSSAVITFLSKSAAVASSVQCVNSVMRISAETVKPSFNDELDSDEWYTAAVQVLDIISLAGGIASGFATIKTALTLRASGLTSKQALQTLTRAQRKRFAQEVIRTNYPGISNKLLKQLIRQQRYPKHYGAIKIRETLRLQLLNAIGATIGFTGSAMSGVVNSVAVGIYEEMSP